MVPTHEARVRERAHRLWEAEDRPAGRALVHWFEAERQLREEEPGGLDSDRAQPPAEALRNPELIPPADDPEYPAITGPEELPPEVPRRAMLDPAEIVDDAEPGTTPRALRVPLRG